MHRVGSSFDDDTGDGQGIMDEPKARFEPEARFEARLNSRVIEIPEPTPEFWAQVLRRWCKQLEEIFAWMPLELRILLYRRVYSCYPAKFTVIDRDRNVILYFEGEYRYSDYYDKQRIRDVASHLREFIDDLIQGRCPRPIVVHGTTIRFIKETRSVRIFTVQDRGDDTIWSESPLCIELVRALITMLELAKE